MVRDALILQKRMSNTEWSCDVSTAALSVADKLVNEVENQVRVAFLGELKCAFADLGQSGSG